jgi:hypothetical protein
MLPALIDFIGESREEYKLFSKPYSAAFVEFAGALIFARRFL